MTKSVIRRPGAPLVFVLLLTACGSQPTPGPDVSVPTVDDTEVAVPLDASESTALLNRVDTLLRDRQMQPAASILTDIEHGKLTLEQQIRYSLLWSQLHYLQGDVTTALVMLQPDQARIAQASVALREQFQRQNLRLLAASGNTLAVARTANRWLPGNEDPEQRRFLLANIWHPLQSSSLAELRQERQHPAEYPHWPGWLDLALVAARVAESPDIQIAEIQLWQQQYPAHPMSNDLPGGLGLLPELASSRPQRIALLLPLSNALANAGQAVLDGYLASQYDATQRGWETQQLLVLDTASYMDINAAYAAAVAAGAELVIGPLAREELAQWAGPGGADAIPLLALNWLDQETGNSSRVYQLSLAPEDEARQVAQLAFDEGARQALLIRPAGAWGDEMSANLVQRWQQLQGEVRATAVYSNRSDYSSSIKAALNLQKSEARARKVRQLMGADVEFSPRRREDIDSVFLLSGQPAEARSIKPLIAFHYAADLPVYSTSQVFSGQFNPQLDRDLNGLRLVQMPWMLQQGELRQTIIASGADATLSAMHALGADAFLLHWRLQQLRASPDNSIRGHTGLLSMGADGRIHRELLAARFRAGVPEPLPQ